MIPSPEHSRLNPRNLTRDLENSRICFKHAPKEVEAKRRMRTCNLTPDSLDFSWNAAFCHAILDLPCRCSLRCWTLSWTSSLQCLPLVFGFWILCRLVGVAGVGSLGLSVSYPLVAFLFRSLFTDNAWGLPLGLAKL